MPKSLRISKVQARVYGVLGSIYLSAEDISKMTSLAESEVKSICLILIAQNLVERLTIDGRMMFRLK